MRTTLQKKEKIMIGFLLPALAAGLIVYAAVDIYRNRENDPRKSKRKNDEYYFDEEYQGDE